MMAAALRRGVREAAGPGISCAASSDSAGAGEDHIGATYGSYGAGAGAGHAPIVLQRCSGCRTCRQRCGMI